jgi:hypothetical protein
VPRSRAGRRSSIANRVTHRPPIVTIEGAQLCAMNAQRLLRDSLVVSEPTAVALCELATEEAAKGLMMMFVIWNKKSNAREETGGGSSGLELRLAHVDQTRLERFVRTHKQYLEGLRGRLWSAFVVHEPKLDFLEFLLKFEQVTAPILAKSPRLVSALPELVLGPVFSPKAEKPGQRFRELAQFLSSVNTDRLRELSDVKNEGFYVGLHKDGTLASPSMRGQVLPWIRALAGLTLAELTFVLAARPRQRAGRVPPGAPIGPLATRD